MSKEERMECLEEGCAKAPQAQGRCDTCYRRHKYQTDPEYRERRKGYVIKSRSKCPVRVTGIRRRCGEPTRSMDGRCPKHQQTHISTPPLRAFIESHREYLRAETVKNFDQVTNFTVARAYNISSHLWKQIWEEDFISLKSADTLCGKFRMHLSEIWGNEWEWAA